MERSVAALDASKKRKLRVSSGRIEYIDLPQFATNLLVQVGGSDKERREEVTRDASAFSQGDRSRGEGERGLPDTKDGKMARELKKKGKPRTFNKGPTR